MSQLSVGKNSIFNCQRTGRPLKCYQYQLFIMAELQEHAKPIHKQHAYDSISPESGKSQIELIYWLATGHTDPYKLLVLGLQHIIIHQVASLNPIMFPQLQIQLRINYKGDTVKLGYKNHLCLFSKLSNWVLIFIYRRPYIYGVF